VLVYTTSCVEVEKAPQCADPVAGAGPVWPGSPGRVHSGGTCGDGRRASGGGGDGSQRRHRPLDSRDGSAERGVEGEDGYVRLVGERLRKRVESRCGSAVTSCNDCLMPRGAPPLRPGRDDLLDALLSASRALVAIAARSLADLDAEVTLPQYRALVVLASRGPQRVVDISAELRVNPSTATRMCDRLVHKKLVRRYRSSNDRREVRLTLTPSGRGLVQEVTERRRAELARLVESMPQSWVRPLTSALRSLSASVGEMPDSEWWLGWVSADELDAAS